MPRDSLPHLLSQWAPAWSPADLRGSLAQKDESSQSDPVSLAPDLRFNLAPRTKQSIAEATKDDWVTVAGCKQKLGGSRESKRQGMRVERQQRCHVLDKTLRPSRAGAGELLRGVVLEAGKETKIPLFMQLTLLMGCPRGTALVGASDLHHHTSFRSDQFHFP